MAFTHFLLLISRRYKHTRGIRKSMSSTRVSLDGCVDMNSGILFPSTVSFTCIMLHTTLASRTSKQACRNHQQQNGDRILKHQKQACKIYLEHNCVYSLCIKTISVHQITWLLYADLHLLKPLSCLKSAKLSLLIS